MNCWIKFLSVSVLGISQQKYSVSEFSWLTGQWEMQKGERQIEKMWLEPAGNTMFSVSRTVKN